MKAGEELKETYYFSHDSNAITDPKILNMRADYGLEGYGLFWCIIEMMRNEENYSLVLDKNTYRAIKSLTNTTIDVEKYLKDCIEDYKLFQEKENYFFSNSLMKRMEEREIKRQAKVDAGRQGGLKSGETRKQRSNIEAVLEATNQSKGKESKGKENKDNIYSILLKEIKEKFPKDDEGRHQDAWDGIKAIRMAREDSRWEQLTPEYQDKLLKEI
jgi:hypothetical protein